MFLAKIDGPPKLKLRRTQDRSLKFKMMTQEIISYLLLALASGYVVYRGYLNVRKQKNCGKCELMKIAKLPKNPTN